MENAYSKAGVNVEAGYEVVERIQKHSQKTQRTGTLGMLGGFGGCFDLSSYKLKEPVLVSGTDGVGTKLLLAIEEQKHETIGIDCVAMCVNDVVAQGAEPLYFLDYLALGTVNPAKVEAIVAGVATGCCEANAALIGGETAEMPDMYEADAYDVAGFAVGIAEKSQLLTPSNVKEGDFLIGLPSSGLHSNGYSLVRNVFFKKHSFKTTDKLPELAPKTLGEELLTPTKIYVKELLPLLKAGLVHGAAHITGGGFFKNLPRMFSSSLAAEIQLNSWPVLPIFKLIQKYGEIPPEEMYEIFNMGLGMILAVSPEHVEKVQELLPEAFEIGRLVPRKTKAVIFKEAL